jgi:murein DD-endopeptidase MepM/ murein hydrolase activator NlpD
MKTIQDFLKQYGGLSFDNVKFRPGAPFRTDFGCDNTFNQFRLHNAIDRGAGQPAENAKLSPICAPFDCVVDYIPVYGGGFGSLLRMVVEDYGFEFRIMHMDGCLVKNGPCKAGTLVGYAGTNGIGTGRHTHQEVVSLLRSAPVLDELIQLKVGNKFDQQLTVEDVKKYFTAHNLKGDPKSAFEAELAKRRVLRWYTAGYCLRNDYHDGKIKTFYDSKLLFGC